MTHEKQDPSRLTKKQSYRAFLLYRISYMAISYTAAEVYYLMIVNKVFIATLLIN